MKLIIEIDKEDREDIGNLHFIREDLKFKIGKAIMNGTPLDDVKAEIETALAKEGNTDTARAQAIALAWVLEILDNIGKKVRKKNEH